MPNDFDRFAPEQIAVIPDGYTAPLDMRPARHIEAERVVKVNVQKIGMMELHEIEAELREQAQGEQDGYLLSIADRMREALGKVSN